MLAKTNVRNANRTVVNVKVIVIFVMIVNAASVSNVEGATHIPRPQIVGVDKV